MGVCLERAFAIVVDVGKSLSKVTLWSRAGEVLDRQLRANARVEDSGLARLDVHGIGDWLIEVLRRYAGEGVEVIIPVAHGAGVAALVDDTLAFAPLDYEQPIPAEILTAYRRLRDPFAVTGSPPLPDGLNLGAQLFWLQSLYPQRFVQSVLMPWPQYWTWFLTGTAASEVTSLGCHSDLWDPSASTFSPMAQKLGWADRFATRFHASQRVGGLCPQLAAATGLPATVSVLAGLHDSNAALLASRTFPDVADEEATLLSTGTWFVAMRSARGSFDTASLPANRDCLVNVDIDGRAVPSSRFMGGREIELLGERIDVSGTDGLTSVLGAPVPILPSQVAGSGPFPAARGGWRVRPADPAGRSAAVALYAALMADASLDLIGARTAIVVEGRFARSEIFVRALASLRPNSRVLVADGDADVSFGALLLALPDLRPSLSLRTIEPLGEDIGGYRDNWQSQIEAAA